MRNLRIGTCSWKYPSWSGLVYSQPKGINYLAEYARRFTTVEVDQWFWSLFPKGKVRLPDPQDVLDYRAAVPDPFRFTVKAPNSITLTHYYARDKSKPPAANPHFLSPDLAAEFLAALAPLEATLGPVIFQFEYLNRQKMESQQALEDALAGFRKRLPSRPQFAIELRNKNYLNGRFLDFLRAQDFLPVLLQGYWMPPVAEVYSAHRDILRQFPAVILRLHGPDREGIEAETGEEWNRIVHPRDEELAALARLAGELAGRGLEIYVNVNNHYEGSAPLTINRFLEFLPH